MSKFNEILVTSYLSYHKNDKIMWLFANTPERSLRKIRWTGGSYVLFKSQFEIRLFLKSFCLT